MMELFMLLTPTGHLSLASIKKTFDEAEQELRIEYPPGSGPIFRGHRIVRVRVQIMEVY